MLAPRRFLPPLAALRALEALDRLGSMTAVAAELSLTQSAVSRQLQGLEEQLGQRLIDRRGRGVQLTPAATLYAAEVRKALGMIAQAGLRLQLPQEGTGALNLALLPSFGMRWLVPRLPDFTRRFPEVTLNLSSRLSRVNFASEPFDAAIVFGRDFGADVGALLLQHETVIAVASPDLLPDGPPRQAEALLSLPLLHIQTRPEAWRDWFAHHGVTRPHVPGMVHDQFTTISQAALHGLGVALLPQYLAQQDLASGRLVPAFGAAIPSPGAYYLIWPRDRPAVPALAPFRDWLAGMSDESDMLPR